MEVKTITIDSCARCGVNVLRGFLAPTHEDGRLCPNCYHSLFGCEGCGHRVEMADGGMEPCPPANNCTWLADWRAQAYLELNEELSANDKEDIRVFVEKEKEYNAKRRALREEHLTYIETLDSIPEEWLASNVHERRKLKVWRGLLKDKYIEMLDALNLKEDERCSLSRIKRYDPSG